MMTYVFKHSIIYLFKRVRNTLFQSCRKYIQSKNLLIALIFNSYPITLCCKHSVRPRQSHLLQIDDEDLDFALQARLLLLQSVDLHHQRLDVLLLLLKTGRVLAATQNHDQQSVTFASKVFRRQI